MYKGPEAGDSLVSSRTCETTVTRARPAEEVGSNERQDCRSRYGPGEAGCPMPW